MCGFGLLSSFATGDGWCGRGSVITHQGESVCAAVLFTSPWQTLLPLLSIRSTTNGSSLGGGKSHQWLDERAMAGRLKEIPPKSACPCKLPFNTNAKPPYPLESMKKILPNPMCWAKRRSHGWYVCLRTSGLFLWLFLVIQWNSLCTAGNLLHDRGTIKDPDLYFSSWPCSYPPPVFLIPHCSSKTLVSTSYRPFLFILSGLYLD